MCICSDAFIDLAVFEAKQRGLPGVALVPVKHPLAGVPEALATERGQGAASRVINALTVAADD